MIIPTYRRELAFVFEIAGCVCFAVIFDRILHAPDASLEMAGCGAEATLVGDDIGPDVLTLLSSVFRLIDVDNGGI